MEKFLRRRFLECLPTKRFVKIAHIGSIFAFLFILNLAFYPVFHFIASIAIIEPHRARVIHYISILNTNIILSTTRYEREEEFYSIPVTVKCNTLESSLEQFVNDEVMEGENAYYCEKCRETVSENN